VLSHNELKPDTRALALYELGLDCLKAGLLDRAEETLRRSAQHPSFEVLAYEQLLPLHEQLGDWQQAAAIAERLEALKGQSYATARAHHLLEQAEESRKAGDAVQAIRFAKRALEIDPSCVRGNLLLGSLHEQAQDWVAALEALSRIAAQDARYLSEAIRAARHVSESSGERERFQQFLDGLLPQHEQATDVWLALAEFIESEQERALYVAHKLAEKPNWRGLVTFLGLAPVRQAGVMSQPVDAFRKALQQAAERRSPYLCRHCGFAPSLLFWRCPSCKQWGTVAPSEENL
jgi:lipopolysaccharide biosynthesis regulator YciM